MVRQTYSFRDIALFGTCPPEIRHSQTLLQRLVRAEGLEPPQLSSLEPKSSASTSSATPALIASIPAAMPRAAAYSMRPFVRSKKMAVFDTASAAPCRLDNHL